MSDSIGVLAAFGAGLLSFLSPCVLPLIPGYLSFMTGLSTTELAEKPSPYKMLVPAMLFVAGFTLVFVGLGATASIVGRALVGYRDLLERIAGIVVVVFGILMLGVVRVPWLYAEARVDLSRARPFGRGAALVMGMAFAAGWTPCVGPILGSILTLAGSTGNVAQGSLLLAVYSMGLGVPFLIVALLFGSLTGVLGWLNRNALTLNRIAGSLLVILGMLMLTGQLGRVSGWLTTLT